MTNTTTYLIASIVVLLCISSCKDEPAKMVTDAIVARPFVASMEENPPQDSRIGVLDANSTFGSLNFNVVSQNPAGAMSVDAKTGVIRVKDSTLFNYEIRDEISGVIAVYNSNDADTVDILLTLLDVDE